MKRASIIMYRVIHPKARRVLLIFLLSHLLAYTSLFIIPAHSVTPNIEFILLLNSSFVALVIVFSVLMYKLLPLSKKSGSNCGMAISQLRFNVLFSSFCGLVGLALICYDRVFLRGIDYSAGLRLARYQWLSSEGGSLASVVGNLLIPYSYVCVFFLVVYSSAVSRIGRFLLGLSAFLGIFGHAALNGGRSNILLALIIVLCAIVIRANKTCDGLKLYSYYKFLPVVVAAILYIGAIIKSSASMGGVDVETLAALGVDSLYGKVSDYFHDLSGIGEYLYLIIYGISYLYHGQWTAQVAYSLPHKEGSYTLYPFSVVLSRLGLIEEPLATGYFSETGAFISLPGAFYYDFGFLGVILLSGLLGVALGVVLNIVAGEKDMGGLKLAFVLYILFVIFLSPVLPAYGLSYLNFILLSFVFLGGLNSILYRRGFSRSAAPV